MTFVGDTSAAVKTATSALHRASSEMKIIGENITKSNLDGYTQKELVYRNNVINGHSAGLILEDVVSKVDPAQREIYWESLASDGYYGNMFNALQELDTDLGHPMKNNNLNVRLTEFKKALQQMTLKPEDATTRQNFVKSAARVADFIQDTAKKIKDFRNRFEHKIAEDVGRVNDLLKLLEGNNSAISFANGTGNPTADLVDIRDKNISALTELIGARKYTNSDDTVSIRIPGKTNLLDTTRAEIVTFNETTNLSPGMTSNPIMVNGVDITSMVGGSIQANRKVVEDLCVGYQEALDRFTEVFRDQVNAVSNRGVSSAPPNSMTGSRTGLAGATAFTGTGNVRVAVIDNTAGSEGTIIETLTIDLSLIVNHDGLRTAINGMTNASAAFTANGEFQLTATNANHGIVMVSESTAPEAQETMTGSNLGLSHYFGFQNLIETPGAFLGAADGIANTVTINS
ncbi:MAG: FlgK family flagellar hook-associated protein, partial [Alphaproteobacteria bacterium]